MTPLDSGQGDGQLPRLREPPASVLPSVHPLCSRGTGAVTAPGCREPAQAGGWWAGSNADQGAGLAVPRGRAPRWGRGGGGRGACACGPRPPLLSFLFSCIQVTDRLNSPSVFVDKYLLPSAVPVHVSGQDFPGPFRNSLIQRSARGVPRASPMCCRQRPRRGLVGRAAAQDRDFPGRGSEAVARRARPRRPDLAPPQGARPSLPAPARGEGQGPTPHLSGVCVLFELHGQTSKKSTCF